MLRTSFIGPLNWPQGNRSTGIVLEIVAYSNLIIIQIVCIQQFADTSVSLFYYPSKMVFIYISGMNCHFENHNQFQTRTGNLPTPTNT